MKIIIESLVVENEQDRLRNLSKMFRDFEISKNESGIVLEEPKLAIPLEFPEYLTIKPEDNYI